VWPNIKQLYKLENIYIYIYIEDISHENDFVIWEWWEYLLAIWSKMDGLDWKILHAPVPILLFYLNTFTIHHLLQSNFHRLSSSCFFFSTQYTTILMYPRLICFKTLKLTVVAVTKYILQRLKKMKGQTTASLYSWRRNHHPPPPSTINFNFLISPTHKTQPFIVFGYALLFQISISLSSLLTNNSLKLIKLIIKVKDWFANYHYTVVIIN
jgi:hypothetical protein